MSTAHNIELQLSSEIAALRQLVERLLHLAEDSADKSLTIPGFCEAEEISRAFYYELRKQGKGPREMRHADGCIRISPEARRDWRREREAETAAE
jgi:hypothetical protein